MFKSNHDTHPTPAVVRTTQIHATLERATLAVTTTHRGRIAIGCTVAFPTVIRTKTALATFTTAATNLMLVLKLIHVSEGSIYLLSGHGEPSEHGSAARLTSAPESFAALSLENA